MSYRLDDPAIDGFDITPSDSVDLPQIAKSIYVGTTGNVKLTTEKGTVLTYKNAQQGSYIIQRTKRVHSTGTTAADLIGAI